MQYYPKCHKNENLISAPKTNSESKGSADDNIETCINESSFFDIPENVVGMHENAGFLGLLKPEMVRYIGSVMS